MIRRIRRGTSVAITICAVGAAMTIGTTPAGADETAPSSAAVDAEALKQACDGGSATDCARLADAYFNGTNVPKDVVRSAQLLKQACDGGNAEGCLALGWHYTHGEGVTKDDVRASKLYKQACDTGAYTGCVRLGQAYAEGKGTTKDAARASQLYKKACDAGVAEGCNHLESHAKAQEAANCIKGSVQSCMKAGDYARACKLKNREACEKLKAEEAAAEAEANAQALAQAIANAPVVLVQDIVMNPHKYADKFVRIRFAIADRPTPTVGHLWDARGDFADNIKVRIAGDANDTTVGKWRGMGVRASVIDSVLGFVRVVGFSTVTPEFYIVDLGLVVRE